MATYKEGTKKMIKGLQASEMSVQTRITEQSAKKVRHVVLTAADFERILPGKRELANEALRRGDQAVELSMEDKQRLAERTGKDLSLLYHVVNEKKPHTASRDLILCAMLLRNEVPNAEDASHTLLCMQRAELFLDTLDRNENCRNLILRLCFDYAAANHFCPVADWLVFANSVILWFNKKLDLQMSALEVGEPDERLEKTHGQLLQAWEAELKTVGFCYLAEYRGKLLQAYMDKHADRLKSKTEAMNEIAEKAQYHSRNAIYVFGSRPREGSRELLIQFAIVMGCNLDETNLLLRQAMLPALYPNRGNDSGQDAKYVEQLDIQGLGVVSRKER